MAAARSIRSSARLVDIDKVAREINGYAVEDVLDADGNVDRQEGRPAQDLWPAAGRRQDGLRQLAVRGLLLSRCRMARATRCPPASGAGQKDPGGLGIYPYYAYSWPVNRRIIYNRCSADSKGNPWPGGKELIWWDAARTSGSARTCPTLRRTKAPGDAGFNDPFIMKTDGKGWLFGALNEGPFPTHYEPVESPTTNALYPNQQNNPAIKIWRNQRRPGRRRQPGRCRPSSPSSPRPIASWSTGRRAACPAGWSGWPKRSPTCSSR